MTVRTRFAPSPTGSLHVGGARTALYCWLHARKHHGRFVLRIEDTDQARSSEAATWGILRDLRWLGLEWDEGPGRDPEGTGPFVQSERLDWYATVFAQLREAGAVYEAWESPEELSALRTEAIASDGVQSYRRKAYTADDLARFEAEGRTPVLRLHVPDHDYHHQDAVLGPIHVPFDSVGDLVVRKADGFPTYHLAVVADDHAMGVTLVIRGQEHLANTAKQLAIYESLGWTPPEFAHIPLIFNPTGGKMSKRDKAKTARAAAKAWVQVQGLHALCVASGLPESQLQAFLDGENDALDTTHAIAQALKLELPMIEVMDFRKGGILAQALLNYLALLGWNAGDDKETYDSLDAIAQAFDMGRVGKTAARFDPIKLLAINKAHMAQIDASELDRAHQSYLEVVPESPLRDWTAERRHKLLELYRHRVATFSELDEVSKLYTHAPSSWSEKAVKKHVLKHGAQAYLPAVREALAALEPWVPASIDASLQALADARAEGQIGKIAQPVRVAITGDGVSPGIGETLELLGKAQTLERIEAFEAYLADL